MIVKPGASIALAVPPMQEAGEKIAGCYAAIGCACIVTSGDERTTLHKGKPVAGDTEDPHYVGKAWDFRIWNVAGTDRLALCQAIAAKLGCHDHFTSQDGALVWQGPEYVMRWEYRGLPNEHLHLQHGHIAIA